MAKKSTQFDGVTYPEPAPMRENGDKMRPDQKREIDPVVQEVIKFREDFKKSLKEEIKDYKAQFSSEELAEREKMADAAAKVYCP